MGEINGARPDPFARSSRWECTDAPLRTSRLSALQWVREGRAHAHCRVAPADTSQWMWASELFPELAEPPFPGATGPASWTERPSRLVAGLLGLLLQLIRTACR